MHTERRLLGRPWAVALCWLFTVTPAAAETPDVAPANARDSFERGYALAQQGDLDGAIAAFQLAYRSRPHFSVLYNLAQAYAASGRPVEAVDAFELYLSLGGAEVGAARAAQVREAIAYHSQRVGTLALWVEPAGATVTLDGVRVGAAPLSSALRVSSGKHVVVVEAAGHVTRVTIVEIKGLARGAASIVLERAAPAQVRIRCALPDVAVRLDESAVSSGSGAPFALPPGGHVLAFSRVGYLPQRFSFEVVSDQRLQLDCSLRRDERFQKLARLTVKHPRGSKLLIDGQPSDGGLLPEGRHMLSVSGKDYETKSQVVDLRVGEPHVLELWPVRTSRWLTEALERRSRTRRTVAYVTGGVGAAAVATAVALYVSGISAHDDWSQRSAELTRRLQQTPSSVTATELDDLIEDENQIRDRDSVALAAGLGGVLALAASGALLLWPDLPAESPLSASARRMNLRFRF